MEFGRCALVCGIAEIRLDRRHREGIDGSDGSDGRDVTLRTESTRGTTVQEDRREGRSSN
ncbi:hypothetical protein CV102_21260 [Natronococcus pandeyae]|uniref:Uncharacterized protein n=1 Tax=Natronococcus pandeyae TaxID=2055836 RepID=A0A8J8PZE4_9EURY|nr:hypothetical protein CV102_21260 [Natronococcus pandeyae]